MIQHARFTFYDADGEEVRPEIVDPVQREDLARVMRQLADSLDPIIDVELVEDSNVEDLGPRRGPVRRRLGHLLALAGLGAGVVSVASQLRDLMATTDHR